MALSPFGNRTDTATDDEIIVQPSKTYRLSFQNGRIRNFIDEKESIKQFIYKAIITARFRFPIYDDDYGCELEDLIGEDLPIELLNSEIPRVIREALIYDERIDDVVNFSITRLNDGLYIVFTVILADGDSFRQEVVV